MSSHLLHAAFGSMVGDLENRQWKTGIWRKQVQVDQISCTYCPLLYFIALQTWKTSRRREEALFQSVKAKEWFCCVAPRHILEVKQHRDHYIKDYVVFRRVLTSVWFSLSQLHYATSYQLTPWIALQNHHCSVSVLVIFMDLMASQLCTVFVQVKTHLLWTCYSWSCSFLH